MEPRIRFFVSPHQNAFFTELAMVLMDELRQLGIETDLIMSPTESRQDDIYVVMPLHEYVALEGEWWLNDDTVAERTIAITAEQPASHHFSINVKYAERVGTLFDISHQAIEAYAANGISAHYLQIGWTRTWDRFVPRPDYRRDILFIGTFSGRRSRQLSSIGRVLWERETRLILSDNSAPNWRGTASFETGEDKRQLMAESRLLINIHQSDELYFERLRATEAAHTGTVLVTEQSTHRGEFIDGVHLEVVPVASMPTRIDELLDDRNKLDALRDAAYQLIRDAPTSAGATTLLDAARDLLSKASGHKVTALVGPRRASPLRPQLRPLWQEALSEIDLLRQAAREVRLDLLQIRRPVLPTGDDGHPVSASYVDFESAAWGAGRQPRVSVIVALYNHREYVREALESAASGSFSDVEIIVVDDGSTDGSGDVVKEWIDNSPHVPARLVRHRVNRGLPASRNLALSHARGEYVFVLDADNEVLPTGMERLVSALDSDEGADFAYGILQRFNPDGPDGLMGYWPWQPWRLRYGNYIDAMALFRRTAMIDLGGYAEDRRLYGWEDYDLYCRLAEKGAAAAFVPTLVARYRASLSSMVSLSNLSQTAGFDALRERVPNLMSGGLEEWTHPLSDWLDDLRRSEAPARRHLGELERRFDALNPAGNDAA